LAEDEHTGSAREYDRTENRNPRRLRYPAFADAVPSVLDRFELLGLLGLLPAHAVIMPEQGPDVSGRRLRLRGEGHSE
jgi:hypothetical protein